MEEALSVGGNTIIAVKFQRRDVPKGWQFHVRSPISADRIIEVYRVEILGTGK